MGSHSPARVLTDQIFECEKQPFVSCPGKEGLLINETFPRSLILDEGLRLEGVNNVLA